MPTLSKAVGAWRRFADWYHQLLCWLLALSIAILIFPVTLQVFARFLTFLPHWI
jgi:TRAP-type C4-dicarboxylate transport system permease small subunit